MALAACECTQEVSETRDSFQRWLQDHFSEEKSIFADACEATSRLSEGQHRQLEGCQDPENAPTPLDACVKVVPEQPPCAETAHLSYSHMPDGDMSRQQVELALPQPGRLLGKNSKRNQTKAQKEAHKRYRERKRQSVSP